MKCIDWQGYRIAAWIGLGMMVVLISIAGVQQGASGALFTGVALAAAGPVIVVQDRVPALGGLLFVLAAIVCAAGWFWNLYQRVWLYDDITHVLATMAATVLVAFFARDSFRRLAAQPVLFSCFVFTLGLALGVAWEVFEFYFLLPHISMSLPDTISDLVMDAVGAALAVPLAMWGLVNRNSGRNRALMS